MFNVCLLLQKSNFLMKLIQMEVQLILCLAIYNLQNNNLVPVILIFTKFESLEAEVFGQLQTNPEYSEEEAIQLTPQLAQENFKKEHLVHFESGRKYPPKKVVYLKSTIDYNCYI